MHRCPCRRRGIRSTGACQTLTWGVIPALVAEIHRAARFRARGWLDTGNKPRYDNVEVAPAGHTGDAEGDDGEVGDLHGAKLGVAGAEESLGVVVLRPGIKDRGLAAQHDPPQPGPV